MLTAFPARASIPFSSTGHVFKPRNQKRELYGSRLDLTTQRI